VEYRSARVDDALVSISILLLFCVTAAVFVDSIMIEAGIAPPLCGHCGRPRRRRLVDDGVCRCC
jgi:hypothetical protein